MFNFQPGTEPSSLETSKTEERRKKLENCFVFSRRSLSLFFGEAEPNRYIFGPYDTDASMMGLSLWGARLSSSREFGLGLEFLFLLVPAKIFFVSERLPGWANRQKMWVSKLSLKKSGWMQKVSFSQPARGQKLQS